MTAVAAGERVALHLLTAGDEEDFVRMVNGSVALHHPWTSPPADARAFHELLGRASSDDFVSLLGRRLDDGTITGVVNFSQIIYGMFQNAYCGFYANAENRALV